ncbi:glycoside hydrolase family 97 catalytic domain-containing protein [Anaeromassilibacillus senegalensis]|uniref:glycoside hydrolase family 97 catalytic domain-containing protein n=1 Tax=Anaeromassilibacillus senegalensis TaxID=1673717 RepID=UPI000681C5A5|nr:glycoside hydrolase family 97 catalytic domain-containing protein [Anaeromassilibacillus senegalensis]
MKKRVWRSLLSLVLAFSMVFSIWAPALARSESAKDWDPSAEYEILTVLKDAGIEVYSGNTSPGATVDLWWNYHGDALYWRLIADENQEYYRIQPKNTTATVLMPVDSQAEAGVNLTVGNIDTADDSQWWKIVPAETDGQYRLLNKASEPGTPAYVALKDDGVNDGTPVVLSDGTTASSCWKLSKVEVAPPEPVDPVMNVSADKTLLQAGESASLKVTAKDEYENTINDYEVRSSNPEVAEVSRTNKGIIVTAKANGVASIVASATLEDESIVEGYTPIIVGTEPIDGVINPLKAPNSEVSALFAYDEAYGAASYVAMQGDSVVVSASPMGIVTSAGDFRSGLKLVDVLETSGTEEYELFGAKVKHVKAPYNQKTFCFEKDGVPYDVILRAFDDGVAFRYSVDGDADTALSISSEHTGVRLPEGAYTWAMNYSQSNEDVEIEHASLKQLNYRYSMPLLYKTTDDIYALISEADLDGTYCGAQIAGDGTGLLNIVFTPEQTDDVQTVLPFASPWRYVVIGDLQAITNNTLAESLAPASKMEDTSWIEAGVTDWTWLNGDLRHDQLPDGVTFETAGLEYYKKYVDFAVEMGWKYQLLDEGWQPRGNRPAGEHEYEGYYKWMPDLIEYAAEKGVGLIVWARKANLVDDEYRQKLFKEWADMGIKGIKPDFFDSQDQDTIQLIVKMMDETAENHLLINVHGAGKPTGERRTWPQAIAREAVRGAEAYAVDNEETWGAIMNAHHNCSLPFVRGAVGPMDYTPMVSYGANDNLTNHNPARFTVAQMTALPVVYECGMQCLADKPDVYRAHPGYEHYFKNMPSEWDEGLLLDGYPGQYVNMARRSGDEWYQGIICNEKQDADFSLNFLGDGEYIAYIYKDSPEVLKDGPAAHGEFGRHDRDGSNLVVDAATVKSSIVEEVRTVTKADSLSIPLAQGGGAAIHFVPKSKVEQEAPQIVKASLITDKLVELKWNQDVKGADAKSSFTVLVNGEPAELNSYGYTAGNGALYFDRMTTLELKNAPAEGANIQVRVTGEVTNELGVAADADAVYIVIDAPFYTQSVQAKSGVTVKSSDAVEPSTLQAAADIIDVMLEKRSDVASAMLANGAALAVYGKGESAYSIPEHRATYDPDMYYVEGYGGMMGNPVASIYDANVLRLLKETSPGHYTSYADESVLVHEFGHSVQLLGVDAVPELKAECDAAYQAAKSQNLWPNSYAISNREEYFATCTAIWFNAMSESSDGSWDGVRGPVNTREELKAYDNTMYQFLAKLYPETAAVSDAWSNVPDRFHPSEQPEEPEWNANALYKIKTALNGHCMESNSNNSGEGAIVDLWWDYDGDAEYWRLIPDANNEYYMVQLKDANSTVLMPAGSKTEEGVTLTFGKTDAANDAQWWKIVPAEQDGTYRLMNKASAASPLYLALEDDASADGTLVILAKDTAPSSVWSVEEQKSNDNFHKADPDAVYLSDLEWINAVDSWFLVRKDLTVNQTQISWKENGETVIYEKGIGTFAPSQAVFNITGLHAETFKAVGCFPAGKGNCEFIVLADGKQIYSKALSYDGNQITPDNGELEVAIPEGTQTLTLYAKGSCSATWADARLYCDKEAQKDLARVTVRAEETWLQKGETSAISATGYIGQVGRGGLQNSKADLTNASITYSSSDESVATVQNGKITAVSDGTASITCNVELDGVKQSASLDIIVGNGEENSWTAFSPDGSVKALFTQRDDGSVVYAVSRNGNTVIGTSPTGLVTNLGDFRTGLTYVDSKRETVKDSYDLIGAKKSHVDATGTELTMGFEKGGVRYRIVCRVYDDGMAFHYAIDGQDGTELTISAEATGFLMPDGSTAQTMDFDKANEDLYYQHTAEELEGGYCMPLLYETPNGDWALLSEAALTPQYSGGQIVGHDSGMLDVVFSPEQFSDVTTTAPFVSPWRYMVIGDIADIAENTLAETLNPDCEMDDVSWIEPSPVDWTWLNGDLRHDNLPEGTSWEETAPRLYKEYIDFAVEMGWKYQLLDEGWQPRVYNRGNDLYDGYYDWMPEVLDYAKEKGIGLIVWANKRDLDTPKERERIKEWAEMGIVGVKPDFFDSQSQEIIELLDILTKETAENHLLINIHGAGKTTGERRTYPNAICREAISGGEGCVNNAYFNCMLPFTRFAVGGADFTPMASYNNTFGRKDVTQAHLTAESIVFECGIQTMADKPAIYRAHAAYENLFKNLPTTWNNSILVDGDPGHYVNMARQNGDSWYVGILCNEARTAEFNLNFLEDGAYTAYIFRDSDDPKNTDSQKAIITETMTVTKGQTLSIDVKKTGGAVVKLVKAGAKALEVTYSGKQASLFVNDEEQKLANLTGSYKAELTPDGKTTLTFIPAVEGREFAGVTVNGEALKDFTEDSYTMTIDGLPTVAKYNLAFTVVNKQILRTVLTAAEALNGGKEYLEAVPSVQKKFDAALKNAQEIEKQLDASQKDIDGAWKDLLHVIQFLSFAKGDKTALEEALAAAGMLDEELYTSASWQAFQKVCEAAQAVYDDEDAMDKEIQEACASLNQAMEDLEDKADWSELLSLMEKAEEIEAVLDSAYLETGRDAFQKALDEARAMEESASQKEINQMTEKLTLAMAGLRKIPNRDELNDLIAEMEQISLNGYTKASAATFAQALSDLKAAAADETADDETLATAYHNAVDAKDNLEKAETPVKPDRKPSGGKGSSTGSSHTYGAAGTAVVNAAQSVSTQGAYVVSDTTVNFTLKRGSAYCFKMTVQGGVNLTPSFTVGNGGILKTQFVAKIGNDCYYRVWAVGTPGQSTGVYTQLPNGKPQKHCAITIA